MPKETPPPPSRNPGSLDTSVWWVNQGKSYRMAKAKQFLFAPKKGARELPPHHWTRMTKVNPGDVIVNYANTQIRGISIATSSAYDYYNPDEKIWNPNGWRVDIDYHTLQPPIPFAKLKNREMALKAALEGCSTPFQSPFQKPNLGYLYDFNLRALELVRNAYGQPFPSAIEAKLGGSGLPLDERAEDELYQQQISIAPPKQLPRKPQKPPKKSNRSGSGYVTDPRIARGVLEQSDYKCSFDPNHITFTSRATGRNYVEAHHLIPMNMQSDFANSLDVSGNIVPLCPTCHKKIHLAHFEEKETLISHLLGQRGKELSVFGLEISLSPLKDIYR